MNEKNLEKGKSTQFRSGEEAARNGRKGGIASGVSRNLKGAVKKELKKNPALLDDIVQMLKDEAFNKRNLKAAEMLIDLMGESVQRETLALRKKEVKLKEAELKKAQKEKEPACSFEDIIVSAYEKRKNNDN